MKIKVPGCLWAPSNPIGSFLRRLWMLRYSQKDRVYPPSLAAVKEMVPFRPDLSTMMMTLNDLTGQFFLRAVFECFCCIIAGEGSSPRSYFISLTVTSSYPIVATSKIVVDTARSERDAPVWGGIPAGSRRCSFTMPILSLEFLPGKRKIKINRCVCPAPTQFMRHSR